MCAPRPICVAVGVASSALLGAACDALVGLDPTILVAPDVVAPDAASPKADVEAESGAVSDAAAVDAPSDAAPCDAGSTTCTSGCADLPSDGLNCGACGHSCLGGTCRGGQCLPQVLTTGNPAMIAVDGTSVYWLDGMYGSVMRCSVDNCRTAETLFPGPGGASGLSAGAIAVQGDRLFFAETGSSQTQSEIYSCPKTGCGISPDSLFVSASPGPPLGVGCIVADAAHVYWAYDRSVYECPIGGCGDGGSPTILGSGLGLVDVRPWGLAVRDGTVYYADVAYGVGTCSMPSGSCMILDTSIQLTATAIAAGPNGVYWASNGANQVLATPLDAGGPIDGLFATVASPGALAVDSENVYFTTQQGGGAIYKCPVAGCNQTPTVVASGLGSLGDLQVDAQRIYVVVGTQRNAPLVPIAPLATITGNAIVWIAK
jgi:hypothetical protein